MRRKKKISVLPRNGILHFLVEDGRTISYHAFPAHETTRESMAAKWKDLKGDSVCEATIVVPREELLSQDFEVAAADAQKALSSRLEKSFPYKIEELAYGLRVDDQTSGRLKGTVVATPAAKLESWIAPLEEAGCTIADVFASDDVLAGHVTRLEPRAAMPRRTLFIDATGGAIECVLVSGGRILFSKTASASSDGLAKEIGLLTLQFESFERILVCGGGPELEAAVGSQFQLPIEKISAPADSKGAAVPCALFAALRAGRGGPSLLPVERKKRKRESQKKKALVEAGASYVLFLVCLAALFGAHWKALEMKAGRLSAKLVGIESQTHSLRRMSETIDAAHARHQENRETLALFKGVMLKTPPGITISSLGISPKSLSLAGEAQDNATIADSLSALKSIAGLLNVRLEYAKLKDAAVDGARFEFLVSAERAS